MLSFPRINISSQDDWSINNYIAKHPWRDSWKARECLIRVLRRDAGLHGVCRQIAYCCPHKHVAVTSTVCTVGRTYSASIICILQVVCVSINVQNFYPWTETITNLTIIISLLLRRRGGCLRNRGSISNILFSPKSPCRLWGSVSLVLQGYLGRFP